MDMAMLIVTFGGVVISAAAAVAAIVQARAAHGSKLAAEDARNESRVARDDAVRLSREANEAFKRQAEAQEESNRIAKASAPRRAPKIEVRAVSDSRWMATNVGDLHATAAQVVGLTGIIRVNDDEPRPLHVGDSLHFYVIKTMQGEDPRIAITMEWLDDDGVPMSTLNEITLP